MAEFDFSKITVEELDKALEGSRFSKPVREIIAKASGKTAEEVAKMPADQYKKLLDGFLTAAFAPVSSDPN